MLVQENIADVTEALRRNVFQDFAICNLTESKHHTETK